MTGDQKTDRGAIPPVFSPGLDANNLILQAIADLCCRGVSEDRALYFHEKAHPLIKRAVEFLMDKLPPDPEIALLYWLADWLQVPETCKKILQDFFRDDNDILLDQKGNPIKSALAQGKGIADGHCKRGSAAFVTPAGKFVSEDALRRVPPLLYEQKKSLVTGLSMFQGLTPEELDNLIKAFELTKYLEGEEVQKQNMVGDGMHIVVRGEGRVSVSTQVGFVRPGDVFGHQELMVGVAPHETIEACSGQLTTMHISSLALKVLGIRKKICTMTRKRAQKIRDMEESGATVIESKTKVERDEDIQLICEGISGNINLMEVLHLSEDQIGLIAGEAHRVEYNEGENVFCRGDAGEHFYIVNEGTFAVIDASIVDHEVSTNQAIKKIRSGGSFGELCVIYNAPRAATVQCSKKGSIWAISRITLKNSVRAKLQGKLVSYAQILSNISVFASCPSDCIPLLCNALEEMYFIQDEEIVQQGNLCDGFFIMYEGSCNEIVDGKEVNRIQHGDHFGEVLNVASLSDKTYKVTSDRCTVLFMDRVVFRLLLRRVDGEESFAWIAENTNTALASRLRSHMEADPQSKENVQGDVLNFGQLEKVGNLGRGAFGLVTLERDKVNDRLIALKAMSKGQIVRERLKAMVLNEKECLQLLNSPFICRLYGVYHDQNSIYFALEPCFGGDLFDVYRSNEDFFGSEPHAQFYAACVASGLDHMHSRHVIYRDLKLENCLFDLNGYIKLADLGIGKVCVGKTYTVCGTADYFAPETLRQTGHNRAVDWWALGVMVFIMMSGRSPFDAPDAMKIYRKIMKGMSKVTFPDEMSENCASIIKALCQQNPEERLTMGTLGIKNFQDNPWYRGFEWKLLPIFSLTPPYMVQLSAQAVIDEACARVVEGFADEPYEDDGSQWDGCTLIPTREPTIPDEN